MPKYDFKGAASQLHYNHTPARVNPPELSEHAPPDPLRSTDPKCFITAITIT